jgi:hypothetical protein
MVTTPRKISVDEPQYREYWNHNIEKSVINGSDGANGK